MICQRYKDYIFDLIHITSLPNHYRIKYAHFLWRRAGLRLHLASGNHYIKGWINIEANPFRKKDCWLDIRSGLPFRTNSVSAIFSSHFLEHLTLETLTAILSECARVLIPHQGVMRIVVPSFEQALQAYLRKDLDWFNIPGRGPSTRFVNWVLCWCQHRLFFDFNYLKELLEDCRFRDIRRSELGHSHFLSQEELAAVDRAASVPDKSMFIECLKE